MAAGFHGPIHPINPHARGGQGRAGTVGPRASFPLASIWRSSPCRAPRSSAVVDDCAAAGVKSLVVVTAGFAEVGADGRALQDQLVDKVRGYGMRMVGPNCMGLLNTDPAVRLNASFSPMFPREGRIALSSQSGALGLAILALAAAREVGLSQFVSVGNKADVSGNDLLEYWESDPRTHVILLYLESFGNPRRFARLARRIGRIQADRRGQSRTDAGRLARGRQPHRGARRERHGRRCAVPPVRRHSRRHHRRDVRHRGVSRRPAAARRAAASRSSPMPADRASWPSTPA